MQRDPTVQLEQRVKTLEYEIKILKSEIQRTLLDIQEQVLVHYYPSLRTDSETPPKNVRRTYASLQGEKGSLEGEAPEASSPAAPPSQPHAVPVSLEKARAENEADDAPSDQEHHDILLSLSEWVTENTTKLGKSRVTRLLEVYIEQDLIEPDFKSLLMRLAALNDQEGTPENASTDVLLSAVLKLDKLIGREANADEALAILEVADLG